jgi:homoserine kinase
VYGGVVVVAADRVIRVPFALDAQVVVWVPGTTTSTDRSRGALADSVSFADAAFNVGRVALLVAALATGDVGALADATADRLHQPGRLAAAPGSAVALEHGRELGAWCGWLSGSGPTVAFLCAPESAESVAAGLPPDGRARVLAIDREGLSLVESG